MNHLIWKGTHYQIGLQWGTWLREHNRNILEQIPFPLTRERLDYAAACVPVYRRYIPEILEELEGLAQGQRCDVRLLQAVVFSMYALPPACHCSCFALAWKGEILLGRNSDFLTALEEQNTNVLYDPTDGGYSFIGNTTSFVQMEDGINQKGLAVGLTSVKPYQPKRGFHAGLLVRYALEHCATVPELLDVLKRLPIGSAQTLTLADKEGNLAVVECNSARMETAWPTEPGKRFVCATNVFHLPGMQRFYVPEEDNWFSEKRYQTMKNALEALDSRPDHVFAQNLLAGQYGFLCQYDRRTGRDTVWSVVYDLGHRKIYRSDSNPGRTGYQEDKRFSFC